MSENVQNGEALVEGGALVTARGLRKSYGAFEAVRGIDFEARAGECLGFLGPNGAGKTTTLRIIGCAIERGGGNLSIFGMDPSSEARRIKSLLGVVPQEDNLDTRISVLENLLLYGRYHNLDRRSRCRQGEELLDFFALSAKARQPVQTLSGGMRRRLLLARGLIQGPRMLLLDEPTTGLDPQARHLIWERLRVLKKRGTTLLLTTHYMEEAEQLCDRILIMDFGRIIAEGSPRELIRRLPGREVVEFTAPRDLRDRIKEILGPFVSSWERLEDRSVAMTQDAEALVSHLSDLEISPELNIHIRRATLEDVFLQLTGRRLSEDAEG